MPSSIFPSSIFPSSIFPSSILPSSIFPSSIFPSSIPPFMPSPDIEFSIFVSCVIDGDDGFSIFSLVEFPQAAKPAAKMTDRAAARAAR